MQSNDTEKEHLYIIEGQSTKEISAKTNISEENIALLTQRDFEKLNRVKTLGFISVIERQCHVDLSSLREEALAYYSEHEANDNSVFSYPIMKGRRPRSKSLMGIMLLLLVFASWYFLLQYNKKHPAEYPPLSERNSSGTAAILADGLTVDSEISVAVKTEETSGYGESKPVKVMPQKELAQKPAEEAGSTEGNATQRSSDTPENNTSSEPDMRNSLSQDMTDEVEKVTIVPKKRLWFGVIDMDTKKRKHYTIAGKFDIEVAQKRWLVATSPAPFSIEGIETKRFNDARAHYLKLDKEGIRVLTRQQYIALGGYPKW